MRLFKHSHAILVGINAYRNGIPPLRTALADATRLAQALERDHGYIVDRLTENVTLSRLRELSTPLCTTAWDWIRRSPYTTPYVALLP